MGGAQSLDNEPQRNGHFEDSLGGGGGGEQQRN
jgi:hypothetical protein